MSTSFKKSILPLIFAMIFTGCHTLRDHRTGEQTAVFVGVDSLLKFTGNARLDSLLQLAATSPHDTNLVKLYIDIGQLYADNDFGKAKENYLKAGNLSEQLNWNDGRYMYASGFSNMLYREGLVDSGIVVIGHAYELAKKENAERWIAKTAMNLGSGYFYKSWYQTTLAYYQEALQILEKTQDTETLTRLYDNSGVVARIMGSPDKAVEYDKKALALLGDNETLLKGYVLYNLATASDLLSDEKTEYYFEEALRICKQHNSKYVMAAIYLGLGNLILITNEKEAEDYFYKTLEITTEINNPNLKGLATLCLSIIELFKNNVKEAEQYCMESLHIAQEIGYVEYQISAYRQLASIFAAKNNFKTGAKYVIKADSLERYMERENTFRIAEEISAKYETEKKELKISALEDERRLLIWLGIAGGAVLLLTLALFLFLWRLTVQKRRLAEQQVKQLEQEKQLIATQSLLDGETQERSRLARDLHDGLGSILTGTRLNLQEMKKDAMMNPKMQERYNTAYALLDESIREMRRIAHHLMPEAISAAGLKQAAADFCRTIPQATFHYFGDETRFDPRKEIVMYRIMHELVNNALKHSGATHILVQIIRDADTVSLTVQDNGCGFDPATVSNGMGLNNIRTRVAAFNGNLMIDAKPGAGTEVNVVVEVG